MIMRDAAQQTMLPKPPSVPAAPRIAVVENDPGTRNRVSAELEAWGYEVVDCDDCAVNESEARFRALVETSFDAIVISQNGVFVEVNRGFLEMFGYQTMQD